MKEAVITCVVTMPFQSFFSVNAADNLNLPLHSVASGRDKKLVRASVLFWNDACQSQLGASGGLKMAEWGPGI